MKNNIIAILAILSIVLATLLFIDRDESEEVDVAKYKRILRQNEMMAQKLKEASDSIEIRYVRDTVIIKERYVEKSDSIHKLNANESVELFSRYIHSGE